ncbi:hypothetical protein HanRHA438_Chr03g0114521 [Helianthus annuus]|nr:hypothetical protein HanIR_Chr03g0113041 [Helianthus annuus]KAJ0935049.1 hypothetical protein HanRHA438_Chr03g0114521 [Helianthus annuus]
MILRKVSSGSFSTIFTFRFLKSFHKVKASSSQNTSTLSKSKSLIDFGSSSKPVQPVASIVSRVSNSPICAGNSQRFKHWDRSMILKFLRFVIDSGNVGSSVHEASRKTSKFDKFPKSTESEVSLWQLVMLSFLRHFKLHKLAGNVTRSSQDSISISKRLVNLLGKSLLKLLPILHMIKDNFRRFSNISMVSLIEDIET